MSKNQEQKRVKLTTMIDAKTRRRFRELEIRLLECGIAASLSKPGRVIDVLVQNDQAFDVLRQFFLQSDLHVRYKF